MNIELEELVQQIARKVLNEIDKQERQPSVLIFGKREKGLSSDIAKVVDTNDGVFYYDDQYEFDKIDRFILPCLYIDQMVDLAIGKGGGRLLYGVRQVLLAGKKVEVAEFEYSQFIKTAPVSLVSLYKQYHKKLKQFGIVELLTQPASSLYIKSGLVTEDVIVKANQDRNVCIEVSGNCCVTPLAYDCAKKHSIVIKRAEEV